MAAIDTIEVLDNLQFDQQATAEIWAIDGEGSAFDCVKTYPVPLPDTASAARVIFNNNLDLGACQVHVRVKVTKLTSMASGVPTKTENTQVLEWTAIAAQGFLDSGTADLSAAIEATLHIDMALTSAVAHTGTEIIVQIRDEATTPNEWTNWATFSGPAGTPFHLHPNATCNAGQKVITVDNPTAGNLNHIGKTIFIVNATVANSEICYITACGADA